MAGKARAARALQLGLVGAVLAFCLHTTAGAVRPARVALVGAAVLGDPSAALAAANALWKPDEPASAPAPSPTQTTPNLPAAPADPVQNPPPLALTPSPTPEIRPDGWGTILPEFYSQGNGAGYVECGRGSLKNNTTLTDAEVAAEIANGLPFHLQKNSDQPQILVMHTHATETYNLQSGRYFDPDWGARTTDLQKNVCAVGQALTDALNAGGFVTLHDTTLHDYPSYNGSYAASNATVRAYLQQYPSIRVVLDVHRDAIERDGVRVKPVASVQGQPAAQIMIICGCDRGGNLPNFRQNLRFAAAFEARLESDHPGLTRPVLFDYRYYNQDLTTGSLLLEVGGHANTLDEARYSGRLAGESLAKLFRNE